MKRVRVLILAISVVLHSCNETDDQIIPPVEEPNNFFPLTTGNYWIYENFRVDTSGNEEKISRIDTTVVLGDTLIDKVIYKIVESSHYPLRKSRYYYKDSLHYIVDHKGLIIVDQKVSGEQLNYLVETSGKDTIFQQWDRMIDLDSNISVPIGCFKVSGIESKMKMGQTSPAKNTVRHRYTYYSNEVGNVFETNFYFASPYIFERRLVEYHLQ